MEVSKQNNQPKTPTKPVDRKMLENFEGFLKDTEGSFVGDTPYCPLEHMFSPGIYVRQITIPKDTLLVGKIHKHKHPNMLLQGEVIMVTEDGGEERITAPKTMISEPGTKRAIYTVTDTIWTTIHLNPTNTQNLDELEKEVIAKDFDEYDKFIISNNNLKNRFKKLLIRKLSK